MRKLGKCRAERLNWRFFHAGPNAPFSTHAASPSRMMTTTAHTLAATAHMCHFDPAATAHENNEDFFTLNFDYILGPAQIIQRFSE